MQTPEKNSRDPVRTERGFVIALALLAAVLSATAQSERSPAANIVAMSPESPAALASRAPFYLRIRYQSSQPLRFQAAGFRSGREVAAAMMNPSPVYPAGEGDAIAWLAYESGALIDEARVNVYDERWQKIGSTPVKVEVKWIQAVAARPAPAPWVKELNDAQQHAVSSAMRDYTNRGSSWWSSGIVLLIMWLVPGYLAMQIFALIRLQGTRRLVAALPLVVMIPAYAFSALALVHGSNLWPIWIIFLSPVAFFYVLAIWLISRKRVSTG